MDSIPIHIGPRSSNFTLLPILWFSPSALFGKSSLADTAHIKRLVDKFRNTGSLVDNNKDHSGRPFSTRTPAYIQAVRDHLQQSPRKSTRRLSQEVGISRTSVQRVIDKDLTLFPNKIQILQQQTDANKRERLDSAKASLKELKTTRESSTSFSSAMKPIFISVDMSTNKTCTFRHLISPMNTSSHHWAKKK